MVENSKLVELFNVGWVNCSTAEKVDIHNTYARENNPDDEIYENDEEFFETYFEGRPFEAVRSSYFGHYKFSDNYVWFNGYANLDSSNFVDEMPIYVDEMIDWLIENYDEISYIDAMKEFCDACENGFDDEDDGDF